MGTLPDYEEAPGMLKINKDLGWSCEEELREKCRSLLTANATSLIIDLTAANHVCSANLVIFAYVAAMAAKSSKTLRVIASKRVARLFEIAGFNEFLNLQVV